MKPPMTNNLLSCWRKSQVMFVLSSRNIQGLCADSILRIYLRMYNHVIITIQCKTLLLKGKSELINTDGFKLYGFSIFYRNGSQHLSIVSSKYLHLVLALLVVFSERMCKACCLTFLLASINDNSKRRWHGA